MIYVYHYNAEKAIGGPKIDGIARLNRRILDQESYFELKQHIVDAIFKETGASIPWQNMRILSLSYQGEDVE